MLEFLFSLLRSKRVNGMVVEPFALPGQSIAQSMSLTFIHLLHNHVQVSEAY